MTNRDVMFRETLFCATKNAKNITFNRLIITQQDINRWEQL